ncbi:MAG: hypothetical protein HN368_15010 [Spirochaetales bacterium]|nr:hypothetical protein [Spirochaetales bacterium]
MIQNRSVLDWPKGTTVFKPDKCYNGFTIINPFLSRTVYLINMMGEVVHQWQIYETEDGGEPLHSDFLEKQAGNSLLSILWRNERNFERHDNICQNRLVQFDWDGKVIWRYQAPAGVSIHHDIERLLNGNTVILGYERNRIPEISKEIISDDYYREIDKNGNVVWEWFTCDHFDEFGFSDETKRLMYDAGGDLFHTNTCTVLPKTPLGERDARFAAGNILGSQRNLGLVFIVDRKSGKVVWHWGAQEDGLVGQHHPTMLHNGNILIYDNGGSSGYPLRHRPKTRLIEIEPASGEIVWEYGYEYNMRLSSKFSGSSWGSAQRLPNGNTLSLDTHSGRVFEVTPFGEIVWEFINPFPWGASLREMSLREIEYGMYRVFRYPYEDFPEVLPRYIHADGFEGKRSVPEFLPEYLGLPGADPE